MNDHGEFRDTLSFPTSDPRSPFYNPSRSKMSFDAIGCPPLYRDTDDARLPQDVWNKVKNWQYGPRGIALSGASRTCKTRMMWMLCKKMAEQKKSIKVYDGFGFGVAASSIMGKIEDAEEWMDSLVRPDILFLDDLFKARMTEAQEFAIYGVLERRGAWMKPIFITMNADGESIMSRFTDAGQADRAKPIIERIAEFCEVIKVGNAKKA
jgi:DNA replication protein DnaC